MTIGRLLTILVTGRSAGYEQLLLLRLLRRFRTVQPSAAQWWDSPVGWHDSDHTAHVAAALPRWLDEWFWLAFEGEFNRQEATDALGSNLVGEFSSQRVFGPFADERG